MVIPLTVSEVADVEIRGRLGSFLILLHNAGVVLGYILCSYMDYYMVPWIPVTLSVVFLIGYSVVHETPKYCLLKGQPERAKKAIRYFKGLKDDHSVELILKTLDVGGGKTAFSWSDFCKFYEKQKILQTKQAFLEKKSPKGGFYGSS